jgi:acyl-CoA synthetase (NDP forming)
MSAGEEAARDVRPLLEPRSLVLVGASPRRPAAVIGAQRGGIPAWGVNPNRAEVCGLPCFARLRDCPEAAETAVLLVGHKDIEQVVADAVECGIRNFVVPGLGNEAGVAASEVLARIMQRIADVDGRMLGPNCMGIAVPDGPSPWLSLLPDSFLPGHVAAVAQSGSIAEALLSVGPRVGFRAVVSCGGEADVGIADFLDFFAGDERTRAVGLFVETVRRPEAFAAALERCAELGKPVVCLKVGASDAGARAALAHTGALVGSRRAFAALLRRSGALQVDDLPELIETLEVLGRRRWPRGTRMGGVSESGGEAALLADRGEENGLRFDPLPTEARETLAREFPALLAPQNPVDAWAADEPERIFPRSLEILAVSGAFDALLAQVDLSRFRSPEDQDWNRVVLEGLGHAAGRHGLFAAATTAHTSDPPEWASTLARELDIALLRGTRDATAAIARVASWRPRTPSAPSWGEPIAIDDLLVRRGALPEHESASILERYGVPFAARRRASTPEEAAQAVRDLGAPVVIKRDGPAHKARDAGVQLGIDTPEAAALAARRMGCPVLVARQAAPGTELFCGVVRDRDYGPVVAVGRGGVDVEGHTDTAVVLGPLSRQDAVRLVEEAGLPDPHGTLARAAEAVSRLAHEHPQVVEIDINPVICNDADTIAVDALVVVSDADDLPAA